MPDGAKCQTARNAEEREMPDCAETATDYAIGGLVASVV
jgi:hypothetical protein